MLGDTPGHQRKRFNIALPDELATSRRKGRAAGGRAEQVERERERDGRVEENVEMAIVEEIDSRDREKTGVLY